MQLEKLSKRLEEKQLKLADTQMDYITFGYDSNDIVYGKLLYKVKCNETNMVSDEFLCSFYIPLAMDYSNFEVLVDSLQTSDVELVF